MCSGDREGRHHNPMDPFVGQRSGLYRPLRAFWVSTGARAAELLGAAAGDVDPGLKVITVVRKGTRVAAAGGAGVPGCVRVARLYQAQLDGQHVADFLRLARCGHQ